VPLTKSAKSGLPEGLIPALTPDARKPIGNFTEKSVSEEFQFGQRVLGMVSNFLQVLSAISILGKNVKDELETCLKLRNGCGHPNSFVVGAHKASSHVETPIQNILPSFNSRKLFIEE
jgi:hypothetical protein